MWDWKKTAMIGLESSGIYYTRRSTAKQYMDRSSKRHSKKGG